jgi:predicted amidohydrolase
MTAPRFTAACLQMRSGRDPLKNRDDAVALAREAAAAGAHFVQTPEMTSLLERDRAAFREKVGPEGSDPTLQALREVARERRIVVHIGSIPVQAGDKVANRAFLIDADGEIVTSYDKVHLFDVAENGASFLSAPAAFTRQTGEAHWHVLHRARAIETGSFMISAAQGGKHEDGRETYGHSLIVDPWGRVLAEGGTEPGVVMAEIDTSLVADARSRIPTLKHGRPFRVEVAQSPRKVDAA